MCQIPKRFIPRRNNQKVVRRQNHNLSQEVVPQGRFGQTKSTDSADPRSGMPEHFDLGEVYLPPYPPLPWGSPLASTKILGGSRLKETNLSEGLFKKGKKNSHGGFSFIFGSIFDFLGLSPKPVVRGCFRACPTTLPQWRPWSPPSGAKSS